MNPVKTNLGIVLLPLTLAAFINTTYAEALTGVDVLRSVGGGGGGQASVSTNWPYLYNINTEENIQDPPVQSTADGNFSQQLSENASVPFATVNSLSSQDSTVTAGSASLHITGDLHVTNSALFTNNGDPVFDGNNNWVSGGQSGGGGFGSGSNLVVNFYIDEPFAVTLSAATSSPTRLVNLPGNGAGFYIQGADLAYGEWTYGSGTHASFDSSTPGTIKRLLAAGPYAVSAFAYDASGSSLVGGNDSYNATRSVNFTVDVKPNEWKGGGSWGSGGDGVWTGADPGSNTIGTLVAKFRTATPGGVAGTVTLDQDRTVNGLIFNNTNSYTISGSNVLTLQDAPYIAPYITVETGTHTIATPVALTYDAVISGSANTQLTIAGDITAVDGDGSLAGARTLTMNGLGTLTLSGAQDYSSLITDAGTTNLAGPLGSGSSSLYANGGTTNISVSETLASLNIGDGAVVTFGAESGGLANFDAGFGAQDGSDMVESASIASPVNVPEPGTMGLLVVGVIAGGVLGRRYSLRGIW